MTWKIHFIDFWHQNSKKSNFQVQTEVTEITWKQFDKVKKNSTENYILHIVLTQKHRSVTIVKALND